MDSEIRLLAVELVNLREEFGIKSKSFILSRISSNRDNEATTTEKSSKTGPLHQFQRTLKSLLGLNIISIWTVILFMVVFFWSTLAHSYYQNPREFFPTLGGSKNDCWIENSQVILEFGRPSFNCHRCQNLTVFPVERNISRVQFLKKYAFTGVPVLIKNAINDWNAIKTFSYSWFQETYDNFTNSYEVQDMNGQFFPYKTDFQDLEEALHMSEDRQKKPWYFGWSNAHPEVGRILREQYKRPKFLPDGSDSGIDWIFMGTRGKGANIHLDNVARPSWQAQIQGSKTWFLVPSAECDSVCHEINATMYPGDIIVVDTNAWFHGTEISPGEISITIGSEYD